MRREIESREEAIYTPLRFESRVVGSSPPVLPFLKRLGLSPIRQVLVVAKQNLGPDSDVDCISRLAS